MFVYISCRMKLMQKSSTLVRLQQVSRVIGLCDFISNLFFKIKGLYDHRDQAHNQRINCSKIISLISCEISRGRLFVCLHQWFYRWSTFWLDCLLAEYECLLIAHIQFNIPVGLICLLLPPRFWPQLWTNLWEAWNVTANGISNLPLLMLNALNAKH